MAGTPSRRRFMKTLAGGLLTGAAAESLLELLPSRAADAQVLPDIVRFTPDMEPVVRWIEETPRADALRKAIDALQGGLPFRKLLGGVFLAGIRNIKPRPVGFKFHAVLAVNAAHQLALDAPQSERLLPLLWALDNFKASQEQDVKEGDWSLAPVKEANVPSPSRARAMFTEAMERWDDEAADTAVAGLCRAAGASEVLEILWPYAARDWQNIGHKIIFAAGAARTLRTIGWEHAEPVLRSLVYGILHGGKSESAAPYDTNRELAAQARADWAAGTPDAKATLDLLETLRKATPAEAAKAALDLLNRGVAPRSLWDGILLAASDLLMRSPGIVALHAVTAANSLHAAFEESGRDATRLLCLLQAASWTALFREAVRGRNGLPDGPRIETLERTPQGEAHDAADVFATLRKDRLAAARMVVASAECGHTPAEFIDEARRLVFAKGNDSHDYKYAAALFEEHSRASPQWRGRLLASGVYQLPGSGDPDSSYFTRAREALQGL